MQEASASGNICLFESGPIPDLSNLHLNNLKNKKIKKPRSTFEKLAAGVVLGEKGEPGEGAPFPPDSRTAGTLPG